MKNRNYFFVFIIPIFLIVSGCTAKTPLIIATANGDSVALARLVSEGVNINEPDSSGYTPLMHATWSGKIEMVKILIDKGADINKYDKNGYTSLHWASSYGYSDIVRLLIDKGADSSLKNNDGQTPFALAKSYNHIDIIKILNPTYYDSIKLVIITDAFIYRETLSLDDSSFVKSHMADAAKMYFGEKGYNNVYIQNTPHNAIKAAIKYTESIKPEKNNKETFENIIVDPYLLEKLDRIKTEKNASHILILVGNGKIVSKARSIAVGVSSVALSLAISAGTFVSSGWPISAMQTSVVLIDIEKQRILCSYSSKIKGGGFTEDIYYSSGGSWNNSFLSPLNDYIQ